MYSDISIYNFLPITDRLFTAGQPEESELQQLRLLQINTVINLGLCDTEYALHDEAASVRDLGMCYVHIPVEWQSPQKDQLVSFLRCMNENKHARLFVHCAANKRVSIFVAIYRLLCLKESRQEVDVGIAEIWQANATWTRFLNEMLSDNSLLREKDLS